MKISDRALALLKNFSSINQSIVIRKGNVLSTIHPMQTILAKANVDDTFGNTMAIHDLPQFLQVLSLFKQPELELGTTSVLIHDDNKQSHYFYAEESLIDKPPTKEIKLESNVTFDLPFQALSSILKAASILSVADIAFVAEGGTLYIRALEFGNQSSNTVSHKLGETSSEDFTAIFKPEYLLRLFDADYTVSLSNQLAKFEAKGLVTYWVAVESKSKF